jgi:hypothetical protein
MKTQRKVVILLPRLAKRRALGFAQFPASQRVFT